MSMSGSTRAATSGERAEREDQLLAAARKVFRDKGYEGATVAEIVEEAGVAQGTFYLYYPSKKDVFFALGQRLYEVMAAHVTDEVAGQLPLDERVRAITAACFDAARENSDLVKLVFFGADSVSAELQAKMAAENPVVVALRRMFEEEIAAGRMKPIDPEIAARLLIGFVRNAVLEAFVLGGGDDAERLQEVAAELFAGAVAGSPRQAP
jgi:AcrR family transcriptional regulator